MQHNKAQLICLILNAEHNKWSFYFSMPNAIKHNLKIFIISTVQCNKTQRFLKKYENAA